MENPTELEMYSGMKLKQHPVTITLSPTQQKNAQLFDR